MPELPEVETIARNLRQGDEYGPALPGRRVVSAELFWPRTLVEPAPEEFSSCLAGRTLQEIGRRGKLLFFSFNPLFLLIHLRMSGDMRVLPASQPTALHDRLKITFEEDLCLVFNDPRKFGRAWLVSDPHRVWQNLGPEPLDPGLTPEQFHLKLSSFHRQIKPLLLDQSFLAGLGNIYTDEALFLARIHPLQASNSLQMDQANRLLSAIRSVLEEGILRHGASIDWVYRGGDFQNTFQVYQRTGEPCRVCQTPIQRILVGQRGTHFCPQCQVIVM